LTGQRRDPFRECRTALRHRAGGAARSDLADRAEFVPVPHRPIRRRRPPIRLFFLALRPTRGLLSFFGRDTSTIGRAELPSVRRRIGVVFQDFRLLDHLTTFENVALPLRVLGREESAYRGDVVELLRWVGLGDRMHALPPILSGGEKQRAAIARALITRPEILLADEPTGNVDPPLAARLMRLFVELNRLGTSVVIATHDIALMNQFDSRRLVLEEGRLTIYD
jgi:cell division transport system ATP-binding protein